MWTLSGKKDIVFRHHFWKIFPIKVGAVTVGHPVPAVESENFAKGLDWNRSLSLLSLCQSRTINGR